MKKQTNLYFPREYMSREIVLMDSFFRWLTHYYTTFLWKTIFHWVSFSSEVQSLQWNMDTHKSGEAVMRICGILACGSLPPKAGAPHCETFDSFFPPLYFIHSEHVVICVCGFIFHLEPSGWKWQLCRPFTSICLINLSPENKDKLSHVPSATTTWQLFLDVIIPFNSQ